MDGDKAEMVFTDPRYNVAIDGNVSGLGVNAARGQLRSQQVFTKLLSETERARKAAIEYKFKWERELERRQKLRVTGREPIPHSDDVRLDFKAEQVFFKGPMTKEEKAESRRRRSVEGVAALALDPRQTTSVSASLNAQAVGHRTGRSATSTMLRLSWRPPRMMIRPSSRPIANAP